MTNQMSYHALRRAGVSRAIALKAAISLDLLNEQEIEQMQSCFSNKIQQIDRRMKDIEAIAREYDLTLQKNRHEHP